MQSLKISILFCLLFFSWTIEAKKIEPIKGDKLFSVEIKKRYIKEQTILYKDKKELICRTEINPHYYVSKKINEKDLFLQLEKIKKRADLNGSALDCSNHEIVRLFQGKKIWRVCLNEVEVHTFVNKLSDICGRSL